ncbi:MAG: glycosyltransferase [Verrucomicrobiota bacterium]
MADQHRVLILSVSAGSGHVRAAEALAKSCETHPRVSHVLNVDALTYTSKLFRDFYSKLYLEMVRNAPALLGWFYETSDEPWKTDQMRLMMDRLNTGPLIKLIRRNNPDIIICTHFMPAGIISHLISRKKIDSHLSIVVTDYHVHSMWLSRVFHHYFVANEECKAYLAALGFPEDRILVSGIPIDPVFARRKDRAELRRRYGLRQDAPVILLSAGTFGVTAAEEMVAALQRLKTPAQVVVVCGRNHALQLRVDARVKGFEPPHPEYRVIGYTADMDEWMALADLYIGKPGGLTAAEALARHLPMILFEPIPGQEERNSDYLLENGAALKCNELMTLAFKTDALLQDGPRTRAMRAAAARLARPNAAREIVQHLIAELHRAPVALRGGEAGRPRSSAGRRGIL